MKVPVNLAILVLCVLMVGLCRGQSPSVTDGDFQSPTVGSGLGGLGEYDYNSSANTYIDTSSGWYVSKGTNAAGSVTLVNQGLLGSILSPITGDSSSQYMVLNGLTPGVLTVLPQDQGGISQDIATNVGQTYQVNYIAGALSLNVVTSNTGALETGTGPITAVNNPTLLSLSVGTFSNQSFDFTATSTQTTLDFYEPSTLGANVGGVAIDNVSITAVPEPSHTAAIFLGGVMLFSLARRLYTANLLVSRATPKSEPDVAAI